MLEQGGWRNGVRELVIVLSVALVARLFAAWLFRDAQSPVFDERYYTVAAESLTRGLGFPDAFRPPLYSLFMAGVFHFTFDLDVVRAVQILLSLVPVVFVFDVCRRRYGLRAALYSGLACALCPALAHFSHFLWSETLAVVLVSAFFWLADGFDRTDRPAWLFAAGLALGLTALTREIWLYFGVCTAVWVLMRARARGDVRSGALPAALVVVGMAFSILPWTVRNLVELEKFVLISENHWRPIFDGNAYPKDHWYTGNRSKAERASLNALLREMPREDAQALLRDVAFQRIADDQPWWLAKKLIRTTSTMYTATTHELKAIARGWYVGPEARTRVLIATSVVGFFVTMIPGVAALWLVPGGWYKGLVVLGILFVSGTHAIAIAIPRYLVPVLPLYMLGVGPLLVAGLGRDSTGLGAPASQRLRRLGALATLAVFVLVPLPRTLDGVELWKRAGEPRPPVADLEPMRVNPTTQ